MKEKRCRGTGRALGFGCSEISVIHKFGLCLSCFKNWLFNSENGKEYLYKTQLKAKKDVTIEKKRELKEKKEQVAKKSYYEKQLEHEINAIVRLIDNDKGCISCDHGWHKPATRQWHAGHRVSIGSNPTLRYHLFNIFKQCSICNDWKSANERAYDAGIIKIYGKAVYDYIKSLPARYTSLNLSKEELKEKIIIAREIKRDILSGKDYTREEINQRLAIYKNEEDAIPIKRLPTASVRQSGSIL